MTTTGWIRGLWDGLGQLVLPRICGLCGRGVPPTVAAGVGVPSLPICRACWATLVPVGADRCLRCGQPLGRHVGTLDRCPACPSDLGSIVETVAVGRYETSATVPATVAQRDSADEDAGRPEPRPPVLPVEALSTGEIIAELAAAEPDDRPARTMARPSARASSVEPAEPPPGSGPLLAHAIWRLKYQRRTEAAAALGGLLASEVGARVWADQIDAIVPVPLHWRRQLERRLNQAELIAGVLGRALGRPVYPLLRRVKDTPFQTALPRAARARNVRDAFRPPRPWDRVLHGLPPLAGLHLLLVDDVMTTGATLAACSRTLRAAGAAKVYAAIIARA